MKHKAVSKPKFKKTLFKKMLRDLIQNWIQFLAIFLLCFFAFYMLVAFDVDTRGSRISTDEYYKSTNFHDLLAVSEGFTESDLADIRNLPAVENASRRATIRGTALYGKNKKIEMNFIEEDLITATFSMSGEPYAPGEKGIWIDHHFAEAQGLSVGDVITLYYNGIPFMETIRGLIDEAEYLYFVFDDSYTEPNYGDYCYAFLDASEYPDEGIIYDKLYVDLKSVSNQFFLTDEDMEALEAGKQEIFSALQKQSLSIATKNQDGGFVIVEGDITFNLMMETVFPTMFVLSALLCTITTMTRLTARQRTLIGSLKALGFSSAAIELHYISYTVVISLLGCVSGGVIGVNTLGRYFHELSHTYYSVPVEIEGISSVTVIVLGIVVVSSGLTNFLSCHKLLKLTASEILRPAPPVVAGVGFIEKTFLWKHLGFVTKWNLRDMNRNRLRTFMGLFGVIICSSLMVGSFGVDECFKNQEQWEFGELRPAEYTIRFADQANYLTVYEYARKYSGQMVMETDAELTTTDERTGEAFGRMFTLTVLDTGNLYRLQNADHKYIKLPENGVLITGRAAKTLNTGVGDLITFRLPSEKESYTVRIAGINTNAGAQGITMSRRIYESLGKAFDPHTVYTNMTVSKDIAKENPDLSAVISKREFIRSLHATSEGTDTMIYVVMVMAIMIGIVTMYNLGILSFMEKTREMATLKVLGFPTAKIRWILEQQNLFITGVGTLFGFPVGSVLIQVMFDNLDPTMEYMVDVSVMPYLYAFLLSFVLSAAVNRIITLRVKAINMVEALKGVE